MELPATPAPENTPNVRFDALRRNLAGPLHEPGNPSYTELATPWNLAVASSPAAVLDAANAKDVSEGLKFAAANGLAVAVQATGHGIASDLAGALLIHSRSLNCCNVSPNVSGGTAYTGAGTTWTSVLEVCAGPGLMGLCGSAPGVSVAGYTSGGGLGPMARTFGAASNRVTAIDVVTGDGVLRHATVSDEPELFWGLRGGKGSLGIITGMEFELLPLPTIYAGALFFGADSVELVLRTWAQWCPTLPRAATTSIALMQLPPMPGVPAPLAGKFTIAVRFVFAGDPDDGGSWLAPMRAAGTLLMDTVGPMPSSMIGLVHSDPQDALPVAESSALLADFPEAAVEALLAYAGPGTESPQLIAEIRQLGGALADEPAVPSALCHQQAGYNLYTVGVAAPPELEPIRSHAAGLIQGMSEWAYGGTLPNFSAGTGSAGFAGNYTPQVLEKLMALAGTFDPDRLFRVGQVPTR